LSRPAQLVRETSSFVDAWRILRENGIPTEYDLEKAILEYSRVTGKDPKVLTAEEIIEIKTKLWRTIRR